MIKFYRKIRQNLMSEGKTGKYLKYAIGEILLVVIGILIALQLNNYNDNRKNTDQLKTALKSLVNEIETNVNSLESSIKKIDSDLKDLEDIVHIINTPKPEEVADSVYYNIIQRIGRFMLIPLRKNAFTNLFNSDLINTIKNDSLKLKIIGIETGLQLYNERLEEMNNNWEQLIRPYYIENADILGLRDTLVEQKIPNRFFQINKTAFVNNREFTNMLTVRTFIEQTTRGRFENIKKRLDQIKNDIVLYLQSN